MVSAEAWALLVSSLLMAYGLVAVRRLKRGWEVPKIIYEIIYNIYKW